MLLTFAGGGTTFSCDPTLGFSLTRNTRDNFGKIAVTRGHRVVELGVKLFF
jgi:hypothetical protein